MGPLSVCLSCVLSVYDVGALWPNGWIKMKLGMQLGLGAGHIVLGGTQHPLPQRGSEPPIFGSYLLWPNGWMDQDAT